MVVCWSLLGFPFDRPIIVSTEPRGCSPRSFKYEAYWGDHLECRDISRKVGKTLTMRAQFGRISPKKARTVARHYWDGVEQPLKRQMLKSEASRKSWKK